jgi:hypothetical protein
MKKSAALVLVLLSACFILQTAKGEEQAIVPPENKDTVVKPDGEDKIGVTITSDFYSKYVWRG